jgi:Flp pilus assembly protein TadD
MARTGSEVKNTVTPRELDLLGSLAYRLMRAGRLGEARSLAQGVVALCPEYYYGHALAGALAERGGDRAQARRAYERALRCNPADTASMLNLGRLRLQVGEIEAGLGQIRAAWALEGARDSEVGRLARVLLDSYGGGR